jgi:argininosuccinate synthase
MPDLNSRTQLLNYAEQHQIPIARDKRGEAPFSVDANRYRQGNDQVRF